MDTIEVNRLYVDKSRQNEIRDIKGKGYLEFDNQKDVFLSAMAMGLNLYSGEELPNRGEGFFNDRDLNEEDKAFMYSLVYPSLESLDQIVDKELVYKKAEGMANIGFTLLLDEFASKSPELYLTELLKKTNELYASAKKDGLFDID